VQQQLRGELVGYRRGPRDHGRAGTSAAPGTTTPSSAAPASGAPTTGGDGSPITFGVVTSISGNASSNFSDVETGVKAYVNAINAKGGVNGHPLKYIMADDQSSPTQNLTAAKDLVENKKVVAIGSWGPFLFGSADYLNAKKVPVLGGSFDGPEWGVPKYSNMFGTVGVANPKYPAFSSFRDWIKSKVVTKVAALAYGPSPSSIGSAKGSAASAKAAGIPTVYTNYNVPFGSTDFTAAALAIKQSGADMVLAPMVKSSDLALNTALKQAGVNLKVPLYYTGYDENTINDKAAIAGFEGAYVVGTSPSYDGSNPAATAQMANLHAAGYKGDVPTFGTAGG
jgi:branched-chain amino acid transport system substrate-binding protein